MIKKIIFFVLCISILSACHQQTSDEYENVREIVFDYIEAKGLDGLYNKEMWDDATVKRESISNQYKKYIDENYDGKEIFLVSLDENDAVAVPIFIVDQNIEKVIGVIEGS